MDNHYYTAYDDKGNLIRYERLEDVPVGKQSGAIAEQLYREEGLDVFVAQYNEHRRKEAMGLN